MEGGRKPLQRNAGTVQSSVYLSLKLNDLLPWKAVGFTRPLDLRVTDTDKIANPALCSFSPRDHVSVSVANAHEP